MNFADQDLGHALPLVIGSPYWGCTCAADVERVKKQINSKVERWDKHFLEMAKLVSTMSKDPSTQTGAVIVDPKKRVVSTGFNGFAQKLKDRPEDYENRDVKYKKIIHCEENAILFAQRDLEGCTLYTYPLASCSKCTRLVIQSGISRVVAPELPERLKERWAEEMRLSKEMFDEAGVEYVLYE